MQSAYKICKLEKAITGRPNAFGEFDTAACDGLELLMEHVCYRRLPAVVVYLNTIDRRGKAHAVGDELSETVSETIYHLRSGIDESLVDTQAVIFEVNVAGKRQHPRKYAPAQFAAEHGVVLLASDERASMKAVPLKPYACVGALKSGNVGSYVNRLVVEHHPDDIKSRRVIGHFEIARFVDEHAQCLVNHSTIVKKREWRDVNPATHAESFPRIPVTPPERRNREYYTQSVA